MKFKDLKNGDIFTVQDSSGESVYRFNNGSIYFVKPSKDDLKGHVKIGDVASFVYAPEAIIYLLDTETTYTPKEVKITEIDFDHKFLFKGQKYMRIDNIGAVSVCYSYKTHDIYNISNLNKVTPVVLENV